MRTALTLVLAAITAFLSAPCAALESAKESLDRLAALAGRWEGTFANGRRHEVELRTSAGGTVVVETWTLGPERESITIYHLDGDRLLATHYCPQGNAPRLARVDSHTVDGGDVRLEFAFVDGTGLQPADGWHQQAFWLEPRADGTFARAETYVQNGTTTTDGDADAETIVYTRIGAGG